MAVKRPPPAPGNYISEWFGQRIFPRVRIGNADFVDQQMGICPFLSQVLGGRSECVKPQNSKGVCTVNTADRDRQADWLACPYRVIASDLLADACRIIFGIPKAAAPTAASTLQSLEAVDRFRAAITEDRPGFIFFQAKLGGEISVAPSTKSPEISFDATLLEVRRRGNEFQLGRSGIFEVQTMDFHGSYRKAVKNLSDAARLHVEDFGSVLQKNLAWAGDGIEGPNIANVFKRTFYQAMLKFQLASWGQVAGTVLALPRSVWESWQPFLGAPQFARCEDGSLMMIPEPGAPVPSGRAVITIFELQSSAATSISPLVIAEHVAVDAELLAHHAFRLVPEAISELIALRNPILSRARQRLHRYWPDLR